MKEGVAFNTMSKSHNAPGTSLNPIQPNKEGNPPKRPESPPPIIIFDEKVPVPRSCRGDGVVLCDEKGPVPSCRGDEEVHMSVHIDIYCYEILSPSTSPTGDKQHGDLESEINELNKQLRNCDLNSCCGARGQHPAVKRRRNPVSEAGPEKKHFKLNFPS